MVYVFYVTIGIIFICYVFRKSIVRRVNGKIGEFVVSIILKLFLGRKYKSFNNVILQEDNGKTTQIDHLVISNYGIFVIETKNYKGNIYGKADSQYFTQYIGRTSNQFYNPLKQNSGHIYHLNNLLGDYKYHSIVAFGGRCTLHCKDINNVIYVGELRKYIKSYKVEIYSDEETRVISEKFVSVNKNNEISNRRHVRNIKKEQKDISNNICPRCGSVLVERHGNYGTFMGCSNYPKCKFIRKD